MRTKEARKVLGIMMTADGDCPSCARGLAIQFASVFPEYKWLVLNVYNIKFPDSNEWTLASLDGDIDYYKEMEQEEKEFEEEEGLGGEDEKNG